MTTAVRKAAGFRWTPSRERAAFSLAGGSTRDEAADAAGVSQRTLYRWLDNAEFAAEVDRLTLMMGIATKAERLRIAMRVVHARTQQEPIAQSKADLLDWLKFVQSETDGLKLDLTALLTAATALAGGGPEGTSGHAPPRLTADNGRADTKG
jgi:transposase-like protein